MGSASCACPWCKGGGWKAGGVVVQKIADVARRLPGRADEARAVSGAMPCRVRTDQFQPSPDTSSAPTHAQPGPAPPPAARLFNAAFQRRRQLVASSAYRSVPPPSVHVLLHSLHQRALGHRPDHRIHLLACGRRRGRVRVMVLNTACCCVGCQREAGRRRVRRWHGVAALVVRGQQRGRGGSSRAGRNEPRLAAATPPPRKQPAVEQFLLDQTLSPYKQKASKQWTTSGAQHQQPHPPAATRKEQQQGRGGPAACAPHPHPP